MAVVDEKKTKDFVRARYGEIAKTGGACCPSCGCGDAVVEIGKKIGYSEEELGSVPEAANMGLGCGNPVALASLRTGEVVLDLGSGGGIDVFLAAKKVGSSGRVIGVDMTDAMVERARLNAAKFGYKNVEFRRGEIERLPIEDGVVDAIISNCVINLSPDKAKVFSEAYRVLRHGGRLMVSDLVTEGTLPAEVRRSFAAWAHCIGGALEKTQYVQAIQQAGFKNVRIVSENAYDIDVSEELKGKMTSVHVEAHKK